VSKRPWPKCRECGGPARPRGKPSLSTEYPCETKSELNLREHWARVSKRKQRQSADTTEALAVALGEGQKIPKQGPWFVKLTRVSRGTLDNEDNLPAAFKRIKDTVAAAIGVDDKSRRVRWKYTQAKGKTLGVRLKIWNWRDDE
jgi:hypothetical protein